MTEPPIFDNEETAICRMAERSYKSYKARLIAQERLSARNVAWNASLIATSTATTVASIGLVANGALYGHGGATLLTCLAVLTLVASLVVANMNYGVRARSMELNYKMLQRISTEYEAFKVSAPVMDKLASLKSEYDAAIASSENHTTGDYDRSQDRHKTLKARIDRLVTMAPCLTLVVPLAVLIPLVKWFFS